MANDFYNAAGVPPTGSSLTSANLRAEYAAIAAGFDKMPALSGNAYKLVYCTGAALTVVGGNGLLLLSTTGVPTVIEVGALIVAAPAPGLADADAIPFSDASNSNLLSKITWLNFKAAMKAYLDTIYAALAGFQLTGALYFRSGLNNVASASTTNLSAAGANTVHITGATGINGWIMASGQVCDMVFDGVLTLTHHATNNNLPGGANITTAAGDRATYWYDGTTVWCLSYVTAAPVSGRLIATTYYTAASSSYTKATNAPAYIEVEVWGAGGGGGGCSASGQGGGGGGAGGFSRKKILYATLGASETVTVGAGGTAGANTGGTGGTGGTSSFGAHCSATGGSGGVGNTSNISVAGGAGGSGASGNLNLTGQAGFIATRDTANASYASAGAGGCSTLGGAGQGLTNVAAQNGVDGVANSGSGGGGAFAVATTAKTGGVGGSGLVIVREYS